MTFEEIYASRPDKKEVGSSGYSNLKHLYDYCILLKPKIIIESGTWKGNSSYLFKMACPDAVIICYDIDFSKLMWRHQKIIYNEFDIHNHFHYFENTDDVLLFFDDHINQKKRLKWLIENDFKHVIFDDNIPSGELHTVKNPARPTLQMLKEKGKLPKLKQYKVLPNLIEDKKNTYLTYIEI